MFNSLKKIGTQQAQNAASEAAGNAAGDLAGEAGIELNDEATGAIGDMTGNLIENATQDGQGNANAAANANAAQSQNPYTAGMGAAVRQGIEGQQQEAVSAGVNFGVGAAMGENPGSAQVAGAAAGMARMSLSSSQSSDTRSSLASGVLLGHRTQSVALNYQQPGKKATTILSPHLETIEFGSMLIVLDNSSTNLEIGKPISGKIKVNLKEAFDARALSLGVCGFQRSHFAPAVYSDQFQGQSGMQRLAKNLLSENMVIQTFPEGSPALLGQSEYSFVIDLPDVVTETLMVQFETNNLSTTFYLKAQFEPRNPTMYANLESKISMLRTDYALYMYQPERVENQTLGHPQGVMPNPELTKTLMSKVGGIGGFGASESKSVITLTKNTYFPGEKLHVNIDYDGASCKKSVKSFKIKLVRLVHCLSGKKGTGKPLLTHEQIIFAHKFDGCEANLKLQRTIDFNVPHAEQNYGNCDNLHPELRHMVKMFTDSADNTLFQVEYILQVFVKHQSKLEFGQGERVDFPIEIKSKCQNLPWVSPKEQAWMTEHEVAAWEPSVTYPQVSIRFDKRELEPEEECSPYTPIVTVNEGGVITQRAQEMIQSVGQALTNMVYQEQSNQQQMELQHEEQKDADLARRQAEKEAAEAIARREEAERVAAEQRRQEEEAARAALQKQQEEELAAQQQQEQQVYDESTGTFVQANVDASEFY